MRRFDAEECLALVERERATNTFMVPTMIASLLDAAEAVGANSSGFRTISYGGAPISEALLRRGLEQFGNVFVQVYGSCEAPHPVTILSRADHQNLIDGRAGSIGRPAANSVVRIEDEGDERSEATGEMLIGGDRVLSEYWNNPEASAEAIVEGWYRTGDVTRRDGHGYYYVVDRKRDVIISGGLNVYPAEVERVVSAHPAVVEVAVIGVPDDHWGEAVTAFVVRRPGGEASEESLLDYCRTRLAGYKKPQTIEFRDELPKGNTGKIVKRELREPYWSDRERQVN